MSFSIRRWIANLCAPGSQTEAGKNLTNSGHYRLLDAGDQPSTITGSRRRPRPAVQPRARSGVVAQKIVGGEVHVLLAAAGEVAQLALVEPAGGRDDCAQVPLERLDDEGLGDARQARALAPGPRRLADPANERARTDQRLAASSPTRDWPQQQPRLRL